MHNCPIARNWRQKRLRNCRFAWNWPFGFLTIKANFEQKRQLRRVFWSQFRATGQLRTVFYKRFTFRTIQANLKQNDSCAEWFEANFDQQHGCARCFLKVLSKTANRISWILLTTHTNLGKLTVASPLSHKLEVKRWEYIFRFLFSSRFLLKIYVSLLLLTIRAHLKQNQSCA